MAMITEPEVQEDAPRNRRDPGYAFRCMEEEGICGDDEDDDDDDEDHEDDDDDDDEGRDGEQFDDDEVEGFEDWRMEDELGERDHGPGGYDDDADWTPDVQEELPELIYTEGCDEEGVDLAPCISLQRCNNRLSALQSSANGDGSGGDVDAVRVMLLGVSDSGRPSVGIDLGYACTQQQSSSSNTSSGRSTSSPHGGHSSGGSASSSINGSPLRQEGSNISLSSDARASSASDLPAHSSPSTVSPTMMSRANTTRASRPASPFIFQPPRTPSRSPATPARRSFVFSEWASSNKQTFVFEGSQRDSQDPAHFRQCAPCKFVPTKALTLAMQDASFVGQVLGELPGVKASDPRIVAMLDRIRENAQSGKTTRPSTPTVTGGGDGGKLVRQMSSIRPLMPKRPTSASWCRANSSNSLLSNVGQTSSELQGA